MSGSQPAELPTVAIGARRRGLRARTTRVGLLLVAPSVIVIAVLVVYPSLQSVVGSFQRYRLLSTDRGFTGLGNYATVLQERGFQQAIVNTAGYFVVITIGVLLGGLAMALWLQSVHGALRALALTVIVLPWAVPGAVAGVLWSFILAPTGTGLLNAVVTGLHLSGNQIWLDQPGTSTAVIGLTVVWGGAPLAVVILLAGLEGIPRDLYEQALVDGASRAQQFARITLPLLRPAVAIVLVNSAVLAIGLFDQVYVLVGLDPSSITVAGSIYLYAFRDFDFGFGFAASVIATAVTALIAVIWLKLVYREEEF